MSNEQKVSLWFIDDSQRSFSVSAISNLMTWLVKRRDTIAAALPSGWAPPELNDTIRVASMLFHKLNQHRVGMAAGGVSDGAAYPCEVNAYDLPVLRLAIELHIESLVLTQEATARLSHHQVPQDELAKKIASGRSALQIEPLARTAPAGPFRLSDYLNLETLAKIQGPEGKLRDRIYDAKFHILIDQSIFLDDLRHFQDQCAMRDRPLSVAYIDIDKFGEFNRKLPGKETQVDRDVLPRFMSALEQFVYARGFAYREGGDEYIVLLPNTDHRQANDFFESLRKHLAAVSYPINMAGPTVSIGVCTVSASDRQTALQIQTLANNAKAYAKSGGRDRVAGYQPDKPHSQETLLIVTSTLDSLVHAT